MSLDKAKNTGILIGKPKLSVVNAEITARVIIAQTTGYINLKGANQLLEKKTSNELYSYLLV